MSHDMNTGLLEEAADYINSGDLSSTPMEEMLERDIESGDLTALWEHLKQVRDYLRQEEVCDVY